MKRLLEEEKLKDFTILRYGYALNNEIKNNGDLNIAKLTENKCKECFINTLPDYFYSHKNIKWADLFIAGIPVNIIQELVSSLMNYQTDTKMLKVFEDELVSATIS